MDKKTITAEEIIEMLKETGEVNIDVDCVCKEPVKISNATLEKIVISGGIFEKKFEIDETVTVGKNIRIFCGRYEDDLIINCEVPNGNIFIMNELCKGVYLNGFVGGDVNITPIEFLLNVKLDGEIKGVTMLHGTFNSIFANNDSKLNHLHLFLGSSDCIKLFGQLEKLEISGFDMGNKIHILYSDLKKLKIENVFPR